VTPPRCPALVLSGGGARAAYQVGVLSAIAERAPGVSFPIITGVSAGAINAAYLAGHRGTLGEAVAALREQWSRLRVHHVYRLRPPGIGRAIARSIGRLLRPGHSQASVRGLLDLDPLRRFLAQSLDWEGIDANVAAGRLRAAALSATAYRTGRVVTFVEGGPDVPTWTRAMRVAIRTNLNIQHVLASSSIPILFPAIRINGDFYADGSVRQTAPLAPAIHLGADAVLAIGMRTHQPAVRTEQELRNYPTAAEAMGLLFHSVFLDSLEADAERLQQINAALARRGAEGPAEPFRPVRLLVMKPSQDLGAMAAGHVVLLPPMLRLVVRLLGGGATSGADFLSYLLFDPAYTGRLVTLGYDDAMAQWGTIAQFLEGS